MGAQNSVPSRGGMVRLRRRAPTMGLTTTSELQGAGVDIAHAVKLVEEKIGKEAAAGDGAKNPAAPPTTPPTTASTKSSPAKLHPSAAALQVDLPPWEVVANLGESEWLAFRAWLDGGWKCKKCGHLRDDHADHPRAIKLLCHCGVPIPGYKAPQGASPAMSHGTQGVLNYASESSDAGIGYISDQSGRSASSSRGSSPMHMSAGGRLSRPESPRFANDDRKLSFPERGERMEKEYLGPEACPHLAGMMTAGADVSIGGPDMASQHIASLGLSQQMPGSMPRTVSGDHSGMAAMVPEIMRRQEQELIRKDKILRAVARANQIYFIDKEPNGTLVFDFLLSALLDITNSHFGWISSALLKADGTPYLKTHAITNLAWNKELKAWYAANAHKGLVFTNLNSLHGSIVFSGQPVITNDAQHDPRSRGVPAGHPPITKFFGIPLFTGSELIGIYGVANSPTGYSEQLMHLLEPLTLTIAQMMYAVNERKRRKEAEMQLSSVVQVAREGIMSMSFSGQVTSINMAAREMFGLIPKVAPKPPLGPGGGGGGGGAVEDTAPPMDLHLQEMVPEIDGKTEYLKKGLDPQAGHRHRGVGKRLDGSLFPLEIVITKGSYGTVFFVAVIRDLTEEMALHKKLESCTCGQATQS